MKDNLEDRTKMSQRYVESCADSLFLWAYIFDCDFLFADSTGRKWL